MLFCDDGFGIENHIRNLQLCGITLMTMIRRVCGEIFYQSRSNVQKRLDNTFPKNIKCETNRQHFQLLYISYFIRLDELQRRKVFAALKDNLNWTWQLVKVKVFLHLQSWFYTKCSEKSRGENKIRGHNEVQKL